MMLFGVERTEMGGRNCSA